MLTLTRCCDVHVHGRFDCICHHLISINEQQKGGATSSPFPAELCDNNRLHSCCSWESHHYLDVIIKHSWSSSWSSKWSHTFQASTHQEASAHVQQSVCGYSLCSLCPTRVFKKSSPNCKVGYEAFISQLLLWLCSRFLILFCFVLSTAHSLSGEERLC